jgi:hypothetical protein
MACYLQRVDTVPAMQAIIKDLTVAQHGLNALMASFHKISIQITEALQNLPRQEAEMPSFGNEISPVVHRRC